MTNKNKAETAALKRVVSVVDRMLLAGFATGVLIVVALLVYVLSTGDMPRH